PRTTTSGPRGGAGRCSPGRPPGTGGRCTSGSPQSTGASRRGDDSDRGRGCGRGRAADGSPLALVGGTREVPRGLPPNDVLDGHEQNHEVEREGPAADVVEVVLDALPQRGPPAPAVHLGP